MRKSFTGGGDKILHRMADDEPDKELLSQTALEQVSVNREFRAIAEFLGSVNYLHLVPQVIRDPGRGGGRLLDPFGGDFITQVARTPTRDRERRLKVVNEALKLAVPQLEALELFRDDDGQPHLRARYNHWRPAAAMQDETDFSDGTLRLIGLLWSLMDRGKNVGPILLEEPELSLHAGIVRQLPALISKATKSSGRQVIATTHAAAILEDPGLGLDEVVLLTPGPDATHARGVATIARVGELVDDGFSLLDALRGDLIPPEVDRLMHVSLA